MLSVNKVMEEIKAEAKESNLKPGDAAPPGCSFGWSTEFESVQVIQSNRQHENMIVLGASWPNESDLVENLHQHTVYPGLLYVHED